MDLSLTVPRCPGCDLPVGKTNTRQDPLSKEKIIKSLILIYFQNSSKVSRNPTISQSHETSLRPHGLQYVVVPQVPSHPAAPVVFGWVVLAGAVGMAASALLRAASHQPGTSLFPPLPKPRPCEIRTRVTASLCHPGGGQTSEGDETNLG